MMSRQQRHIQLPLIGIVLVCMLVGVYLLACKHFAKPEPSDTIIRHSLDTQSDDALKYWTADNMRKAKGVELPIVNDLDRGKQHQQRPAI
jgi:hypothetical protein